MLSTFRPCERSQATKTTYCKIVRLREMSKIGKSLKIRSRLVVAWVGVEGGENGRARANR